jgi:hypothetical protein
LPLRGGLSFHNQLASHVHTLRSRTPLRSWSFIASTTAPSQNRPLGLAPAGNVAELALWKVGGTLPRWV